MNQYLAKSDPKETIVEHTDNLLANLNLLKSLYPNIKVDWYLLNEVCLLHDLGKMNVLFQRKLNGKRSRNEIPHGFLSLAFINYEKLESKGYSEEQIKAAYQAVAYHHERPITFDEDDWRNAMIDMEEEVEDFHYAELDEPLFFEPDFSDAFFCLNDRTYSNKVYDIFIFYVMLKGLLNRIDYAASAHVSIEHPSNFLNQAMKKLGYTWNDLQNYMKSEKDHNVIVIAPTGMGKTEAGLLWIGDNKGFFTLPLKAAINAIYDRITDSIVKENKENRVGLLHSETYGQYLNRKEELEGDIEEYVTKTKQLSLPLTICTLDQLFDFVYRYPGFEPKLATLSYSKVIIDEIQMYSPDLLAYLILGLSTLSKFGGKFAILTATLPGVIVDLLKQQEVEFKGPKTFVEDARIRHSLKVIHEEINVNLVKQKYHNNKILVICNTVKQAKKIYETLSEDYGDEVHLLHSQFIKRDRKYKEVEIFKFGQKSNQVHGIWVTTQVVEASLDIDFDLLFTELSDLNGLFQRMGRCYRKRDLDVDYNCYVFDGGNRLCSGVGHVVDKDIFYLSKDLMKTIDGQVTEKYKIELINQLYSTETLENTDYYKTILSTIQYVQSYNDYEMPKEKVRELFRNINSRTVIPESVFQENQAEIQSYIDILRKSQKELNKIEKEHLRKEKAEARIKFADFTVDLPGYLVKPQFVESMKINDFEWYELFDCIYDENGVTGRKSDTNFDDFTF
ncbi:CRISPR-associated helicase Cas3' [Terrilactibacillus laevilacticus]|uniref:CRISPR-associated helicase Cas3 n=1 Tax=Terrilactibacillus laevilacticus TaxID=1380157 RepID=A0ABW5PLB5_9BACI|nr:CRISPR-associated helicase Cas3' [Terrilactibacillus laevilacticus]